jgi:hypothetical protein
MTRGRTRNRAVRVGDNSAVLDVEPSNRGDRRTNKLSDDGDLLVGVDSQTRAKERRVSHAIGVEVASSLITGSLSPVKLSSACECSSEVEFARVWRRTSGPCAGALSKNG